MAKSKLYYSLPCVDKNHDTCNGSYQIPAQPFPLKMMCKCPCHLEKLYAENERLTNLREALEVGMTRE
jgi:hypothetical protein